MAKALQNFESSALHFDPRLLLIGGIVVLGAGLCVWLGGLRWLGVVAGAIGVLAGLIGVGAFSRGGPLALILGPLIAGGAAAFFKKPVIVLSGAGGVAVVALLLLAAPRLRTGMPDGPSHPGPRQEATLDIAETAVAIEEELLFWGETLLGTVNRMSPAVWAGGAAAAAVVAGAGLVFPRLVAAITCAGIGTTCIFAGMILVLLYKGAMPLSSIYNKAAFFGLVVLVMIGFGTLSQLLLCPAQRHTPKGHAERKGGKKK